MTFLWPEAIVVAAAAPAFAALYLRLERRRRFATQRHAALYPPAAGRAIMGRLARHVPLLCFLSSLIVISVALMRPQARIAAFAIKGTVVLALDVSTSMKADDAPPSRLAQAKRLAKAFVAQHADELRVGLASFAAHATPELDPTTGREELFAAIDRLVPREGTALGSAIVTALRMMFPDVDLDADSRLTIDFAPRPAGPIDAAPTAGRAEPVPGSNPGKAIILFSDGQSTTGPDVADATRLAAKLGVRVHTLGVGSIEGKPMRLQGWALRVQLDEAALKEIAAATGGEYVRAGAAIDWAPVMRPIRAQTPPQADYTEITALFAAVAALAAASGALFSLYRTQRIL